MQGTIYDINENRGMAGVLTEEGDFSVFELLSGDAVEKGDKVQWEGDTALGDELLTNVTQATKFHVYFQNHHVSRDNLREQLLFE